MERESRNLGQSKQAKIKFVNKAPKEYEGVQGDILIYNDKIYLKAESRWIIYSPDA